MNTLFAPVAAQLQQLRQGQNAEALAHIFGKTNEERVASYQAVLDYDYKINNVLAEIADNSRDALATLHAQNFGTNAEAADYFIALATRENNVVLTAQSAVATPEPQLTDAMCSQSISTNHDIFLAARGSHLHDWLTKLPKGIFKTYQTPVEKPGLLPNSVQVPNPSDLANWTPETVLADYPWPYGYAGSYLQAESPEHNRFFISSIQAELENGRWVWKIEIGRES
jgi:hypothetical protein